MKNSEKDCDYYYSMINPGIEKSFSYEQRKEIKSILKRAVRIPSRKLIDYHLTFWFIKNLYLLIYLGVDNRSNDRKYPGKGVAVLNILILLFLILFVLFIIIIIVFCLLYTIKSALGVDLFSSVHLKDLFSCVVNAYKH